MTDRMMNYDLDGIFATRNQGQLISTTAAQQKIVRTPGLRQVRSAGQNGLGDGNYRQTLRYTGTGEINLPIIGTISKTTAILGGLGVAAIGVLLFLKFKK